MDSNPKLHKPYTIHVDVAIANTHKSLTKYWFHQESDKVFKIDSIKNHLENGAMSFLIYDSSHPFKIDSVFIRERPGNGDTVKLTSLDKMIFEKVIQFTDSMHIKNFHYLRKAIGFKVVYK